jgi:hypothetical protein
MQHTCVQIIKYTTYVCVWFSFYINVYKYTCICGNCKVCRGSFVKVHVDILSYWWYTYLDFPFRLTLIFGFALLTVYNHIKLQVDLQADKSPIVVKGPFFPRVVNPRYQIHGTNVWCKRWSIKARNLDLQEVKLMHLISKNITRTNLIY